MPGTALGIFGEHLMGDCMRINIWWMVVVAVVCLGPGAGPVRGQALDLAFDFNMPASTEPQTYGAEPLEADAGFGFSLGFYPQQVFAAGPPLRMGIVAGHQEVSIKTRGSSGPGRRYGAFNLQGCADLRLLGNRNVTLTAGLAMGLSFRASDAPCDAPFCGLPESVVLVTPSLRSTIRLSSRVNGLFEVQGSVYFSDQDSTFPFKSGAILAAGLEYGRRGPES